MQRPLAVVLALVGIALLIATIWLPPTLGSPWEHAAYQIADRLWPLLLLAAPAIIVYRQVLRPRIANEFARLTEQAIVGASPPAEVMAALLTRIYGDAHSTDEVAVGVLGGAGTEPRGGDLTVSTNTTVEYELRRVDRRAYELKSTVTYSFKENISDHRLAIFATCDPTLRDSIALACRLPLYEEWFVPNAVLFERSVDEIASSARIGIQYSDLSGNHHDVDPTKVRLNEVSYRDWPEYLTFFREAVGGMPKQNTARYLRTLRIFEFDLGHLAADDHAVGSIRRMSLTSTSLQPLDDPFCYWQAPYPCYLERISFDAVGLAWEGDPSWLFRVVPFTFRSAIASGRWIPARELDHLSVRSWLLPGHGVALMWKPTTDDRTPFSGNNET